MTLTSYCFLKAFIRWGLSSVQRKVRLYEKHKVDWIGSTVSFRGFYFDKSTVCGSDVNGQACNSSKVDERVRILSTAPNFNGKFGIVGTPSSLENCGRETAGGFDPLTYRQFVS